MERLSQFTAVIFILLLIFLSDVFSWSFLNRRMNMFEAVSTEIRSFSKRTYFHTLACYWRVGLWIANRLVLGRVPLKCQFVFYWGGLFSNLETYRLTIVCFGRYTTSYTLPCCSGMFVMNIRICASKFFYHDIISSDKEIFEINVNKSSS